MCPEQALGLQFARATPVKGGPAVRLAGVAEAGVAQRQAPQLAVPAGEGSKSRKVKTEIEDFMLRPMLTRSTHHGLRTVHTGYAYQPPACR